MVQCLGYRHGTECKKVVRTTRHTRCWKEYQLCSNCNKSDKTKSYRESMDVQLVIS